MFDVQSYSAGQLSIRRVTHPLSPRSKPRPSPPPAILGSPPPPHPTRTQRPNTWLVATRAMAKLGEGARANTAALCVSGRRRQRWSLGGWKR